MLYVIDCVLYFVRKKFYFKFWIMYKNFRFCIFDIKYNNFYVFEMCGYSEIRYNINLK